MDEFDRAEVRVSREDKNVLMECIEKIETILNKYPWTRDNRVHIRTTMSRAKTASHTLNEEIHILRVE